MFCQGELVLPLLKSLMHASMPIAGERFMIVPEGLESGQAFSFQTPDPLKLPSIPESVSFCWRVLEVDGCVNGQCKSAFFCYCLICLHGCVKLLHPGWT